MTICTKCKQLLLTFKSTSHYLINTVSDTEIILTRQSNMEQDVTSLCLVSLWLHTF